MALIHDKFTPPTKLDFAEFGTIHKVVTDAGTQEYIQTSRDEEKPHWMTMGQFLYKALSPCVAHKEFLQACLDSFEQQDKAGYKLATRIIDIMNR